MAKKPRTFSPYNYNITYKTPGENPFIMRNKKYVPSAGGGGTEPIYVVTKRTPNYYCYIINNWIYNLNDDGEIEFLGCESEINISNQKLGSGSIFVKDLKSQYSSFISHLNKDNINNYWINEETVKILNPYNVVTDFIILKNNEYYNEKCTIYIDEHDNYDIKFDKKLTSLDVIDIIIYPITYSSTNANDSFSLQKLDANDVIHNTEINKTLIKNKLGSINSKFIIIGNDNRIYPMSSFNVEPSYIEIDNIDLLNINKEYDVKEIYSYSPNNYVETFIIQYGINKHNIEWTSNTVKINHNFNGNVNYILDRNDHRQMIKIVRRVDENAIEIEFNGASYLPNVFSITLFKVSEV